MFLKMYVEIKPEISFQFPGPKPGRKQKRGIDFQIPWAKPGPQLFRAQHFDWARTAIHSVSLWGGWPWQNPQKLKILPNKGVIRGLYAGLYVIGALLLQCRSTITLSASSHSMGNSHMSFKFSHAWGDANSCSGSLHIDEETHDVREVSPSISQVVFIIMRLLLFYSSLCSDGSVRGTP